MEKIELKKTIEKLFADKEFCEKLTMCNSVTEVAELFSQSGVEISAEELEKELAAVSAREKDCELDETELDNVSGGILVSGTAFLIGAALYSAGCLAWAAYLVKSRRR